MSYRADENAEQKSYKLQAIEFVRLAAKRARERKALRDEQWDMATSWGQTMEEQYSDYGYPQAA